MGFEAGLRRAGTLALNALFPPLCMACRSPVSEPHALCADCWNAIQFLDGALCTRCGIPFELDPGPNTVCAACHARPPAFDVARAVMRYDDASKSPVLALKHGDRLDLVPGFARWLSRTGAALLADADVIVPVPLHPLRLWTRRFNQSAELARALGQHAHKPVELLLLRRKRPTASQGTMPSAKARRRNMLGAFDVPKSRKSAIAGRNVLLVDDVLTTGATAEACARALKRAGAAKVFVVALARVARPASGATI